MAATAPSQVIEEFARLFAAGDIEGLVNACYEDDAMFMPEPGTATISGKAALREVIKAFVDTKGTLKILATSDFQNGDIALTHTHWRLDIPGADAMEGQTAEVVRRQPDGSWKYVIDNPWGSAVLGGA
jgi:ketosteroid isomerase-like protein